MRSTEHGLVGVACAVLLASGCISIGGRPAPALGGAAETGPAGEAKVAKTDEDVPPPDKRVIRYDPPTQPQSTDGPSSGNVRVNQDASGFDQNETTVAINPANPDWIVGGGNDARLGRYTAAFYASRDGGRTWNDGPAPYQNYSTQADPTVAYCGDGTAMFGYLDYSGGAFTPHRFLTTRSTNGGVTWLTPGNVFASATGTPFADRPMITCTQAAGTFANRAYASWTNFPNQFSGGTIRVMYSDDRGATWLNSKNVSSSGAQGSMPAAGRNGNAFVFWQRGTTIEVARSTNGGGTWAAAVPVATYVNLSAPNFRRPTYPSGAVDVSSGPFDGRVYVAWHSATNGDADVFVSSSTNNGATWSTPVRVNDDPVGNGRDQFFPWLSVDEKGTVVVKFFDRRHDPANVRQHVYVASSRDGGLTFENERVSDVESISSLTGFLGDYSAIAARSGKAVPLWCDLRAGTGESDVWADRYTTYPYDTVTGLRFTGLDTLAFDDQEPRTGTGIVYDVVRGFAEDLRLADRASLATCAAEDLASPPALVPGAPPAGAAWYYLVRAQGTRGTGGFGTATVRPDPRESYDGGATCAP